MGLHKNSNNGNSTTQPEKLTAAKAIRLNACRAGGGGKAAAFKWSLFAKKHQAKHLQEMKEEEKNAEPTTTTTTDVLAPPTLTRRASTVSLVSNQDDGLLTTSLQEPIEEFPLDAIPQVITLSATQTFVDPISLLMNEIGTTNSQEELPPILDDLKSLLPASTIPDEDSTVCSTAGVGDSTTNDLVGWTATWIE